MPTVSPSPEALAQIKRERLMRAYRDLFGATSGARSDTQRLVWEDLQKVGYARASLFQPDRNGAVCPLRAALAEGRRTAILYIEDAVSFVPEAPKPETPKRR